MLVTFGGLEYSILTYNAYLLPQNVKIWRKIGNFKPICDVKVKVFQEIENQLS